MESDLCPWCKAETADSYMCAKCELCKKCCKCKRDIRQDHKIKCDITKDHKHKRKAYRNYHGPLKATIGEWQDFKNGDKK